MRAEAVSTTINCPACASPTGESKDEVVLTMSRDDALDFYTWKVHKVAGSGPVRTLLDNMSDAISDALEATGEPHLDHRRSMYRLSLERIDVNNQPTVRVS